MIKPGYYNMDCMEGMRQMPDKYIDLAIVDPIYGDVTKGGYMRQNKRYNNDIWNMDKTDGAYFKELKRVSKNQIIWGGKLFYRSVSTLPMLDRMEQRKWQYNICRC